MSYPVYLPLSRAGKHGEDILTDILDTLAKAKQKFPNWPFDPIHQVAIMQEEAGEAVRASIEMVYATGMEPQHLRDELKKELLQTAAMCLRCLQHLYESKPLIFTNTSEYRQDGGPQV